jgi:hypothetical protein
MRQTKQAQITRLQILNIKFFQNTFFKSFEANSKTNKIFNNAFWNSFWHLFTGLGTAFLEKGQNHGPIMYT